MFNLANEKKVDSRIIKTKNSLFSALASLLETEKFSKINISSLTRAANIDRKTFYLHYRSIGDMLDDMARLFISKILDASFPKEASDRHLTILDIKDSNIDEFKEEWRETFTLIDDAIMQGEKRNFILLKAVPTEVLTQRFSKALLKEIESRNMFPDTRSLDVASLYFPASVSAIITLYCEWIKSDQKIPLEQIGEIAANMAARTLIDLACYLEKTNNPEE